ncbi:MAG: TetR/AcrR family transcriptional regulator [Acidimicrobiia bacterium]|nr:TetR/AcrR family transcriptional regulator [Acidimicrobiia bacterium]
MSPSTAAPDLERRQRYLDATRRLLAEHGFERMTMDMVVAEVGGSKATLYKHFPSKVALLHGLMDHIATTINVATPALVDSDEPIEEILTAVGRAAMKGVLSPETITMLRVSLGEYARFPELAAIVWENGPAVTYRHVRELLVERQRRGEIDIDDPQLAAEQFIAGLVGHLQPKIAMGQADTPDDAEIERRVRSAVGTFLYGRARRA